MMASLWGNGTLACSVPVFRYALERWQADPYDLLLFHRGPLSEEQESWVKTMEKASEETPFTNLYVTRVDLEQEIPSEAQELWEKQIEAQTPWMVLLFTARPGAPDPIWAGPLSQSDVACILDSPSRREIAKRLGEGQSGVWVLVKIGDPERDEKASDTLSQALDRLKKELALPNPAEWGMPVVPDSWPGLKVDFTMLEVSRQDPRESLFVDMLLRVEPDLLDYQEPMAFPIFGRGRALYALVGKGIHEENIEEACAFLVGPCLCQIKGMIPGRDLLFSAHWDSLLGENLATNLLPAPFPALAEVQATPKPTDPLLRKPPGEKDRLEQAGQEGEENFSFLLYFLLATCIAALVGGSFSLLLLRRNRS